MHITTALSDELVRYLDLTNSEFRLTANNAANLDTPNYRTAGIDFAQEFERSRAQLLAQRNADDRGQAIRASGGSSLDAPQPKVVAIDGLLERPDGNNVSLDREGLQLAREQMQFRSGVELLKREYTRVMDAIHVDK